jgi:hypothetical protein
MAMISAGADKYADRKFDYLHNRYFVILNENLGLGFAKYSARYSGDSNNTFFFLYEDSKLRKEGLGLGVQLDTNNVYPS